jgi:hypothetical protein
LYLYCICLAICLLCLFLFSLLLCNLLSINSYNQAHCCSAFVVDVVNTCQEVLRVNLLRILYWAREKREKFCRMRFPICEPPKLRSAILVTENYQQVLHLHNFNCILFQNPRPPLALRAVVNSEIR